MHSAQGYLLKSFREKTVKRKLPARNKGTPTTNRKKNGKKRNKKHENHIPLNKNWRIPGSRSRLNREPSAGFENRPQPLFTM